VRAQGHGPPDSICDGIAEAASQALCRAYLTHYGAIAHHNVDKALLVGGQAQPRFGGGLLLAPARLILCGRATPLPAPHQVEELLQHAVRGYLATQLKAPSELFRIEVAVRSNSPNLQQVFARATATANDTSFGVGYAPMSPLEQAVMLLADALRAPSFRAAFPAAGDDFKIIGRRVGKQIGMTVALAFIDRHLANSEA
jgi:S-adenosylmethionine synthetase